MSVSIAIYKYGIGNVYSVKSALEKAGAKAFIVESLSQAGRPDALVLPGVGSMPAAMSRLERERSLLERHIDSGRPILGICLGMQLLYEASTEFGYTRGLGLLQGVVDRLPVKPLPHIGWSIVSVKGQTPLLDGLPSSFYAYFVHSYGSTDTSRGFVKATTSVSSVEFVSVIDMNPVFGTQFHPERSGKHGLMVIRNFVEIAGGR